MSTTTTIHHTAIYVTVYLGSYRFGCDPIPNWIIYAMRGLLRSYLTVLLMHSKLLNQITIQGNNNIALLEICLKFRENSFMLWCEAYYSLDYLLVGVAVWLCTSTLCLIRTLLRLIIRQLFVRRRTSLALLHNLYQTWRIKYIKRFNKTSVKMDIVSYLYFSLNPRLNWWWWWWYQLSFGIRPHLL